MIRAWLIIFLFSNVVSSPFGPPYPITAAIFKNRYSVDEWKQTIEQFKQIGGDTVVLRAPPIVERTKENLDRDPDFSSCQTTSGKSSCYEAATTDLITRGLNITAVVTYNNEENYGSSILSCPEWDKVLQSTAEKKYHRVVLPSWQLSPTCVFPKGATVVVLITVFSGIDPHETLLKVASTTSRNVSVVLGLPAKAEKISVSAIDLRPAYFNWIYRVLNDHTKRYPPLIYNSVYGYYSRDEVVLSNVEVSTMQFYKLLAYSVHTMGKKKLVVPASIDLSKLGSNKSIADHIKGFSKIADLETTGVDVIAVHEGRGYGKAGYYWPTQFNQPINNTDKKLMEILQKLYPTIKANVSFGEVFTGSVQQLFLEIRNYKTLVNKTSDVWLLTEAEENLQDEPCLPVDPKGSGNSLKMNRASKSRVDNSLTAAGAAVQKVMAFAYDPEFTCTTNRDKSPLFEEITRDFGKPIISNCSFHSSFNRSVVLIGYNFDGLTQAFTVDWPDHDGHRHQDDVHGYYFEIDYGVQHGLIPSLEYTQLYDPYDIISLADHGYVKVQAKGSYHGCEFVFDYRDNKSN